LSGDYYSVDQVAGLLGLNPRTVRGYIRKGTLRASKIGKQYRVTQADLEAFTGLPTAGDGRARNRHQQDVRSEAQTSANREYVVSAIVDVGVHDQELVMRITNSVMAAMNSRMQEDVNARADTIYVEGESSLRIVLYGSIGFVKTMLSLIEVVK
jgi:excisionase family DNA binding protein